MNLVKLQPYLNYYWFPHKSINPIRIRSFKNTFFQTSELPFKELLPDHLIRKIQRSGSRRETIFTPLITLRAFLFQVLSANGSCTEAVTHVLIERIGSGHSRNSLNTGSYCKARSRLSLAHLKEAVTVSGRKLHQQSATQWLWHGYRVLMADGTTMLMPDTESNQQTYPQQSVQRPGLGFPIVRLVGLLSLATGACTDYVLAPYQGKGNGETSLFSKLISTLKTDDLLLADRFYTTYAIMAFLQKQGTAMLFRQRSNVKTNFRQGRRLGSKDHIIALKKAKRKPVWLSDQQWLALPDEIYVREFSVAGNVYVTSLLDAKKLPKQQLCLKSSCFFKCSIPFALSFSHGIQNRHKLPHTGDQSDFFKLATRQQALIKLSDRFVVADGA